MSLVSLVDNSRTDKNTNHSYLPLYDTLLSSRKDSAKNVLEIGVHTGGSIKLWHDYFPNATIFGLDCNHIDSMWDKIKNNDRIKIYSSVDAYDHNFIQNQFVKNSVRFDMVLDDGPHTLDSMKTFVNTYSHLLTDNGILILEDVQEWHWIESLKNEVPTELKNFVQTYDLRGNKGRYDDIVLVIDKTKLNV
jgi:predicted O-methyltransferase YrrM